MDNKYKDLIKFGEGYKKYVKLFLSIDSDNRTILLNAEYGVGKTTFIREVLNVKDEFVYSPWLNPSDNYLEEIYYHVRKEDKSKSSSKVLFFIILYSLLSLIFSSVINLLIELYKGTSFNFVFHVFNFNIVFSQGVLFFVLSFLVSLFFLICFIIYRTLSIKPIPFINLFRKDSGKYYEEKIVQSICDTVDDVLVIEDIDRCDDINSILLAINKISVYMNKNYHNKYVLLTGSYSFLLQMLNNNNQVFFDNNNIYQNRNNKGMITLDKIISVVYNFLPVEDRVRYLLKEKNIKMVSNFEINEIANFMAQKGINIRFINIFLENYKKDKNRNVSLFKSLLIYYQNHTFINYNQDFCNYSIFIISLPYTCLNDIELAIANGIEEFSNTDSISSIKTKSFKSNNYLKGIDKINTIFKDILIKKKVDMINVFLEYYNDELQRYPYLYTDAIGKNTSINIGNSISGDYYNTLKNYMINRYNSSNSGVLFDFERYGFAQEIYQDNREYVKTTIPVVVGKQCNNVDDFTVAIIACFFRDNIDIIQNKYPELYSIIIGLKSNTNK